MTVVSAQDGRAVFRQPYREDLVGDAATGVIAGGVVTTLLDSACGAAVFSALTNPTSIATLDLRIDYMRRARPGQAIIAEAHCFKLTHTVAFVRAIAHDGDPQDPVAAVQAAFMINSDGGRGPGANLEGRKT